MTLRISRQELVQLIRETRFRYRNAIGRKNKSKLINHIVSVSGMSRKWVIRLLSGTEEIQNRMRGAPEKLTGRDVLLLKELWLFLNQPGAEYLHKMLPELLREYREMGGGSCEEQQVERICSVSYKTIERALKPYRTRIQKEENSLSIFIKKANIPLVEPIRQVEKPGYICIDTVMHCGTTTAGSYVCTLTWTDIYSDFTINVAMWNHSFEAVKRAILFCMSMTPFKVLSVNTDNGSEFMNCNMISFWAKYPKIKLTHSRPMHKNDNAHAEQKNRTHVRELFGRSRLEKEEYVEKMNYIYSIFNLLQNYFVPCKKVYAREYNRKSHRWKYKYDTPKAPWERLYESTELTEEEKDRLIKNRKTLSIIKLRNLLNSCLNEFFNLLREDPAAY